MSSKNVCLSLQKPVSCFDCQCNILSDVFLVVLEAVDWSRIKFIDFYRGKGRPHRHSRLAMLKAFIYMGLAGIGSVSEFVRFLEKHPYKMNILGFDQLPSESTFSRFKDMVDVDRIMTLLNTQIRAENPYYMRLVGVDSTPIRAFKKDPDAMWGWDHINNGWYYGYKANMFYDLPTLTPLCFTLTTANVHDSTQLKPLVEKHGTNTLLMKGLLADSAYDSKKNVQRMASIGITMINRLNKRKSKTKHKYRVQDHVKIHGNTLNHLYKNRMDCEYTNQFLKGRLGMKQVNTMRMFRVKAKIGLTMIARQTQVLYQLKQQANPRTTIIT